MKKTIVRRVAISLVFIIISTLAVSEALSKLVPTLGIVYEFEREYPNRALDNAITYVIDPDTIFASLDRGETNAFLPLPANTATSVPSWKPTSYFWDQQNYLKIADALHKFVWKESLEEWYLYSAHFRVFQCQDSFGGFDQAQFTFYSVDKNSYFVHEIWITPSDREVGAGNAIYKNNGKWKQIDLKKVKVGNASEALSIAEENGGKEARFNNDNKCSIHILLDPFVYEYEFLPGLITRHDWGWNVEYAGESINIYEIAIDPNTGKFKVRK